MFQKKISDEAIEALFLAFINNSKKKALGKP
jgi:hypothetical protein